MRRPFSVIASMASAVVLLAGAAPAAELPLLRDLQRQLGSPGGTVPVYEPHLSVGDRHIVVDYVGCPAVDVIAHLFGDDWQRKARTVEFRALDGYVSRIDVGRFVEESAYLVFARKDGAPFTVDNVEQNRMDVPLGPYYLVGDNVSSPALLAEGARNGPYQVKEVRLVSLSDDALLPAGLDARFREGAELVRTHCLSCHEVNGLGGAKFEGNLAEIMKDHGRADFLRLVLTPASARSVATMPALSDRLSEAERRRIAESMFDDLNAVPVRPSTSASEGR